MNPVDSASDRTNDEIAALIETLLQVGQRLEQLTGGEVDTVADRDGRTFLLRGTQQQLRDSEATRQAVTLNNQRALKFHNERLEQAVAERTHQLAEANQRLIILDRSKNDFLNLISHEFRTPLNGILGVGELILEGLPSNQENVELQELFERSRCRLLSILDDALLLTQIDVSGDKFRPAPVSLNATLGRAIEGVLVLAQSRSVTIAAPTDGPELVMGNEDLLVRALQALLETAVKFSADGQTVRLSGKAESQTVVIESQGRTIPDAFVEKFFDVLAIGEAMTPGGDLGLGPSLAYRILSLFGASVRVENREPSGIRMTVSFMSPA